MDDVMSLLSSTGACIGFCRARPTSHRNAASGYSDKADEPKKKSAEELAKSQAAIGASKLFRKLLA